MRIMDKYGIKEVSEVRISENRGIVIGDTFYATGVHTKQVAKDLLECGYASLKFFDMYEEGRLAAPETDNSAMFLD